MKLISWLLEYPRTAGVAVLTIISAAMAAYLREQIREALLWALAPITRRLPWNAAETDNLATIFRRTALSSEVSIVELYLTRSDGKLSRYRKTSVYTVNSPLRAYREGVTASGYAKQFRRAPRIIAPWSLAVKSDSRIARDLAAEAFDGSVRFLRCGQSA